MRSDEPILPGKSGLRWPYRALSIAFLQKDSADDADDTRLLGAGVSCDVLGRLAARNGRRDRSRAFGRGSDRIVLTKTSIGHRKTSRERVPRPGPGGACRMGRRRSEPARSDVDTLRVFPPVASAATDTTPSDYSAEAERMENPEPQLATLAMPMFVVVQGITVLRCATVLGPWGAALACCGW